MSTDISTNQPLTTRRGIITWAISSVMAKVFMGIVLFWPAGNLRWLWGWVYIAIVALSDLATALVVIPRHPDLLIERIRTQRNAKSWDKLFIWLVASFLPTTTAVVAGLDERWGWLPGIAPNAQIAAAFASALGYGMMVWAMGTNAFFLATVCIQKERGHTVATGGPYRLVRHPGYVGGIILTIAAPIMLGSVWALIPAGINAILYIVRTALEDKTLHEELEGYPEYARRTRYRLLPGGW